MLRRIFAFQASLLLACFAAVGQTNSTAAPLPYIAHFKTTTVRTLVDGSKSTSVSMSVQAADLHGHFINSYTDNSGGPGGQPRTDFQVRDSVNLTMSYWSVPGTSAHVVHMPDLGEPETDCAKKIKAIGPLHPAGAGQLPVEDLGTKTFLGVEAKGGRISFTPGIVAVKPAEVASGVDAPIPLRRTNEVWTATDPRLHGLNVRMVFTTSQGATITTEMVDFKQANPDPKLFEIPTGRQITKREGHAYSCGAPQQLKPGPAQ
jgi:hypothetical protein